MRKLTILLLILLVAAVAHGQEPSLKQCSGSANLLAAVNFEGSLKGMTAGDELNLSSRYARCLDLYQKDLTPAQWDTLDRAVYKLDADVIARMFAFLERHHMNETFNDEEEARKTK